MRIGREIAMTGDYAYASQPVRKGLIEPFKTVLDVLLADIAVRIQLTPSSHRMAVERYEALSKHVERDGSILKGKVDLFYPQGSMAIGSTIAAKLDKDEFDVDIIVQLNYHRDVSPQQALDDLYKAIKGQPGSRYYDCTGRNTRCVTVNYADGMHIDFTPSVLIPERDARTSHIFHHNPQEPSNFAKTLMVNPFGFAAWFHQQTPPEQGFIIPYLEKVMTYDNSLLLEKAETEKLPDKKPVPVSMAVVAHQLIKRWRNSIYDKRSGRKPPSVMMAKMIGEAAGKTVTLSDELLFQARHLYRTIAEAHNNDRLVKIMNPACSDRDCFTDRWPEDRSSQHTFLNDLSSFIQKVELLKKDNLSLEETQKVLVGLFGEKPTLEAVRSFNRQQGNAVQAGSSHISPSRRGIDLAASGLAGSAAAGTARAASGTISGGKNTFYGGEEKTCYLRSDSKLKE